jgi:maltose phosphorylase
MNKYIKADEWSIIEEEFDPKRHNSSESIFSLGNGHMGQRANFEEHYSGKTLQGSYIAGIYYPDKTRVGWWKNGYPEYFAKVLNSPNWIGIDVQLDSEYLDIAKCRTKNFVRTLNMKEGYLQRSFNVEMPLENEFKINSIRFLSKADPEIGIIKYSIIPIKKESEIILTPYIDGDVKNEDSNYNEKFWNIIESESSEFEGFLLSQTKKLDFYVGFAMKYKIEMNGKEISGHPNLIKESKYTGNSIKINVNAGDELTIQKFVSVVTSLDYQYEELKVNAFKKVAKAFSTGYKAMFQAHKEKWNSIWTHSDIVIKGDIEAQQGIRFNIFHLNQTYSGNDERFNIGPKGFTGEKYGGTTYWDTEAYCIPFFISTSPSKVTKNLLLYRYKHLQKAIENAEKLGFNNGAALYPMVTMNGEECHNEWEITFEEIHRNGAIAFAIYNYIRHTGDDQYLADYGLEVLIGIARFWAQRATWSDEKQKYVILGVTGPNEYENNVNNNWYTNTVASWSLDYAVETITKVKKIDSKKFHELVVKTKLDEIKEPQFWKYVSSKMYYAFNEKLNIFLQQDGFMDKEQILAKDLDQKQRPINQHWSWDRILRSCFIKQADTLQGIYLFEERFDIDFIKRHFEFYESRTLHESSLSPCVHSILAAKIGNIEKAYEFYLRTSRLDIDDYNNEVHEGLHITSMAGTWMSIVEGFGGKRVHDGKLYLNPQIHHNWEEYSFRILIKDCDLNVTINKKEVDLLYMGDKPILINIFNKEIEILPNVVKKVELNKNN